MSIDVDFMHCAHIIIWFSRNQISLHTHVFLFMLAGLRSKDGFFISDILHSFIFCLTSNILHSFVDLNKVYSPWSLWLRPISDNTYDSYSAFFDMSSLNIHLRSDLCGLANTKIEHAKTHLEIIFILLLFTLFPSIHCSDLCFL